MPEYLSPGVYVVEVPGGARPIEGVSTSTAGFVGTIVKEMRRVLHPYVPEWTEHADHDPHTALIELMAWLADAMLYGGHDTPERAVPYASRLAAAALAVVASNPHPRAEPLGPLRFYPGLLLNDDDLSVDVRYTKGGRSAGREARQPGTD